MTLGTQPPATSNALPTSMNRGALLRAAVGIAVSIVSMWLLLRAIDVQASLRILRSADPILVTVAVSCLFVSLAAKIARWRLLLPRRASVSFPRLFGIVQISLFLNNVLPLRVGDGVRCAMTVRGHGIRLAHVLSSMVAERVVDAATLVVAFLLVMPFLPYSPVHLSFTHVALPAAIGAGVAGVAAVAFVVTRRYATEAWSRALPALAALADSWRRLVSAEGWRIWVWSLLAWASAFAINFVLMHALNIEVSPVVAVVLGCSTNLAMLVPSSPAQIGVYHAAATFTLTAFGVDHTTAVSFSVLAHLVNVVPVSLVGAAFLVAELFVLRRRSGPREALEG